MPPVVGIRLQRVSGGAKRRQKGAALPGEGKNTKMQSDNELPRAMEVLSYDTRVDINPSRHGKDGKQDCFASSSSSSSFSSSFYARQKEMFYHFEKRMARDFAGKFDFFSLILIKLNLKTIGTLCVGLG